MSACNCCEEPPGTTVSFVCDHVEGDAEKCGFAEIEGHESTPPKFYGTKTIVTEAHDTFSVDHGGGDTETQTKTSLKTETYTRTIVDGVCTEAGPDCDGEGSVTKAITGTGECDFTGSWDPCTESEPEADCFPSIDGLCAEETSLTEFTDAESTGSHSKIGFARVLEPCAESGWTGSIQVGEYIETTLSEEDVGMIARAEGMLTYAGTFIDCAGPIALRALAEDETTYEVSRTKFKLKHTATPSCFLKVWLDNVFTPEVGSPTTTEFDVYEWNGTGSPCYTGTADAEILSPEYELLEPVTNGVNEIVVRKFSYIPGYTPPDDGSANGWPTP